MIGVALLVLAVVLPVAAALTTMRYGEAKYQAALRLSAAAALALTLVASLAVVDAVVPLGGAPGSATAGLAGGRALVMTPLAQLGIQLLALAMLGLVLALGHEAPGLIGWWLPVAWLSVAGLNVALLVNSMPIALLIFVGAALLWAVGLPHLAARALPGAVLNYAALLALAMPLVLIAFRLAESRTVTTPDAPTLEWLVLALAVPGFGLILAFIPLHAWALTLAQGTPRVMFFGVLTIVQTAGFVLLLRALQNYAWITGVARTPLVVGGALSTCLGGWLALSARRDDPDDWLVYAAIANGGILLTGLGTQSATAGAAIALLLFVRVLSLVVLALGVRVDRPLERMSTAAATLALAGTPGLAGFPALWVVLRRLQALGADSPALVALSGGALLAGSSFLFATAIRRWHAPSIGGGMDAEDEDVSGGWDEEGAVGDRASPNVGGTWVDQGARHAMWVLLGLLIFLGLAPQVIAPAFTDALVRMFFRAQ